MKSLAAQEDRQDCTGYESYTRQKAATRAQEPCTISSIVADSPRLRRFVKKIGVDVGVPERRGGRMCRKHFGSRRKSTRKANRPVAKRDREESPRPQRLRCYRDNKTLSSTSPLISSAEWRALADVGFQRLAHDYLRARFGKNAEIKPGPPKGPDGGRDFEIIFRHPHRPYKALVECKNHERAIDLATLGKYVVVAIVNHAKELHVVSSSPISGPARGQLAQVMGGMNVDIALIDGVILEAELLRYDVLDKYFPGKITRRVAVNPAEALRVDVHVRANPDFDLERADTVTEFRAYKDQFYVQVLLKNVGPVPVRIAGVSVESEALLVARDALYGAAPTEMFSLQDCSIIYGCRLVSPRDVIGDGQVSVSFDVAGSTHARRVPLPKLDFHSLSEPPLVGEALKRFLSETVPRLSRDVEQHQARLIDIRGVSGVGKTRLLDEFAARARESGVATLRFDAMRAGDNVFRRLLAGLVSLPLFEGQLAHTPHDLEKILIERGCSVKYAEPLGRFLIDETSGWSNRYAVTEALKHFLRRPAIAAPVAIIIDNVQELSPQGLDVLLELTEFMERKSARICLAVATNTESMPAVMRRPIDEFHRRLEAKTDGIFRAAVYVEPLILEDAKLLVYSLLNGIPPQPRKRTPKSSDAVVEAFIAKAGLRALDLVMAIRYLEENGIIERTGALRWYIPKFRRFRDALETVPSGSGALIRRRLAAIRQHQPRLWAGACEVLKALVAFAGRIPVAFVAANQSALDLLLDRSFIRPEAREGPAAYVAYHDNIFRYLEGHRAWRPNRAQSRCVVRWIESQPAPLRSSFATVHLFSSISAGASDAQIVALGERALAAAESENPVVLRKVGERLNEYVRGKDLERSDFQRYLSIRIRYATVLLLQAAVNEGLEIFDDLAGYVRAGAPLDESTRNAFYHEYVNANLHCARYDAALRILRQRERNMPSDPLAIFLTYDRHGVAATALGDLGHALFWLDRALAAARGNPEWQCTAHYDLAYVHVHLSHDPRKAIASFQRSLKAHEAAPYKPIGRQIEAAQMRAFIALLSSDFDMALDEAENGLWLSNRHNLSYYAVKLLNMLGTIRVVSGDLDAGIEAFDEGMSRATMSLNARAYWRAIANLGAVAAIRGDYAAACDHLATIDATLRQTLVDTRALARELSILANYVAILAAIGADRAVGDVLDHWSCKRLNAFAASLPSRRLEVPGIVRHQTGFALLPS